MSSDIDALIQQIGNGLLDSLEMFGVEDGHWVRAWVIVGKTDGFSGMFGRYIDPADPDDPTSFDPDFELFLDPVDQLHKVMAAEHGSLWTGAIFHVEAPAKYKVDFHYPEPGEEDLAWYGEKMRQDTG